MKRSGWGVFFIMLITISTLGQQTDSLNSKQETKTVSNSFTLLIYARIISDAKSNFRYDQNAVANFKLNKLIKMEIGLRHGEKNNQIGAYDQYKVELQSKRFFKTVRFLARMSDNVIRYSSPIYSRTNFLVVTESNLPISDKWDAIINWGYELTNQKNYTLQAEPILSFEKQSNHGLYKIGLRYMLNTHGSLEASYSSYDLFNPYLLTQPFTQIFCDYELFKHGTLYSYFRYQYDKDFGVPLNNFLGLGIRFHL